MTGNSHNEMASTSRVEQRNMRCGILHGAFFQMGTAFADPYAVVPLFLSGFTESRALIGLIVSLIEALTIVPQLGVSRHIRRNCGLARPIMLAGIWMRCAAWGIIALTTILVSNQIFWILAVFILLVAVYSLGAGLAVLPFRRVISETITPERRGTFFGGRLAAGGVLAALAGMVVKSILGNEGLAWPRNYGILFAFSFISLAIAYTAMSCLRFPPKPATRSPHGLPPLREEIHDIWKAYPVLKRLIGVRLLSGGLPLVLPFLTLYATKEVGIPLAWVGIFVAAQQIGAIFANVAWMPLHNRFGTRSVIQAGLGLAVISLTMIAAFESGVAVALAFALSGGAMSAIKVGFSGYILELGTPEIRPLLFALEGTLLMPLYFMPLLGGSLADALGYRPLVLLGGVMLLGALILARTLCEPRRADPSCGPCVVSEELR